MKQDSARALSVACASITRGACALLGASAAWHDSHQQSHRQASKRVDSNRAPQPSPTKPASLLHHK